MAKRTFVIDEEYEGPRWTYGLKFRPMMMGAQPKGFIIGSEREHADWRYGTVQYPRELTAAEMYSFEMESL